MFSIIVLMLFNMLVLMYPPHPLRNILELMEIPFTASIALLFAVIFNVAACLMYEEWGTFVVSKGIGALVRFQQGWRRSREGKAYKVVEGGMR